MSSGAYSKSQFLLEFNSNLVFPGDFHRYIFPDIAKNYIDQPNQKKDNLMEFITDGSLVQMAKEYENTCDSQDVIGTVNTIYHELTHYTQGLSLGSELLRDILVSHIGGCLVNVLREYSQSKTKLRAPAYETLGKNNVVGHTIQELMDRYEGIYNASVTIDMGCGEKIDITVEDLLEGYAAIKSYYWMMKVESEKSKNEHSNFNSNYFNENLDETYQKAWTVYKKLVPFPREGYEKGKITEELIRDVCCFLMVCDISLHIPLFLYDEYGQIINEKIPEYCLPHLRFKKALNTLTRNNGFPDAVKGTDFYITLYDFIALDNGWPTFQEVNKKWQKYLLSRLMYSFMNSDLYRLIALDYKTQWPTGIEITEPPIYFFNRTGIPILIKYNLKDNKLSNDNKFSNEDFFFEYLYLWYGNFMPVMDDLPLSPMKDPYNIMAHPWYYNSWTFTDVRKVIEGEDYMHILEIAPTFLREIYCRIISRAFFKAVIEGNKFSCPVIELNCKVKRDECTCLKKLTDLPEHCCLKVWLQDQKISPTSVIWE